MKLTKKTKLSKKRIKKTCKKHKKKRKGGGYRDLSENAILTNEQVIELKMMTQDEMVQDLDFSLNNENKEVTVEIKSVPLFKLVQIATESSSNTEQTYSVKCFKKIYDMTSINKSIFKNCSRDRLIQFTGTCWLNTILNMFILPNSLKQILIEGLSRYIINNGENFYKNDEMNKDIFNRDIYHSQENLKKFFFSLLFSCFNKTITFNEDKIISKFASMLNTIVGPHINNKQRIIRKIISFISENKLIVLINIEDDNNEIIETNKMIDGIKYVLQSCYIAIEYEDSNIGHAACGYVCDNDYYIFDSHNYVSIDDWNNNSFTNYLKFLERFRGEKVKSIKIRFLLYVKNEFQTGGGEQHKRSYHLFNGQLVEYENKISRIENIMSLGVYISFVIYDLSLTAVIDLLQNVKSEIENTENRKKNIIHVLKNIKKNCWFLFGYQDVDIVSKTINSFIRQNILNDNEYDTVLKSVQEDS